MRHGNSLLLLLLLSPALARPPTWSWDTVQNFIHCGNVSGPLSDAVLSAMAAAKFSVIEKYHALRQPPVFTGYEGKFNLVVQQVRALNPNATVLMYFQGDWARSWFDAGAYFDARPSLEVHNGDGAGGWGPLFNFTNTDQNTVVWHAFDFGNPAAVDAWVGAIASIIAGAGADGVLVDGVSGHPGNNLTKAQMNSFREGNGGAGVKLAAALPAESTLIANNCFPPGYTGTMDEFFSPSWGSMKGALGWPNGTLMELHVNSRGGVFNNTLAAYLVIAREGMYFGGTDPTGDDWSSCEGWASPRTNGLYRKALGQPTGPFQNASWVLNRSFASGTRVRLDLRPNGSPRVQPPSCICAF